MPQKLPQWAMDRLDEIFRGPHSDCVDGCKSAYGRCLGAGTDKGQCRDDLESCLNGCPDGLRLAPEILAKLTKLEEDLKIRK
jgi:hypothetical protein